MVQADTGFIYLNRLTLMKSISVSAIATQVKILVKIFREARVQALLNEERWISASPNSFLPHDKVADDGSGAAG